MGKRGPVSLESESQSAEVEVERRAFRSVAPAAELSGARLRVGRIPAKPHPGIASCDMPRQSCELTGG